MHGDQKHKRADDLDLGLLRGTSLPLRTFSNSSLAAFPSLCLLLISSSDCSLNGSASAKHFEQPKTTRKRCGDEIILEDGREKAERKKKKHFPLVLLKLRWHSKENYHLLDRLKSTNW